MIAIDTNVVVRYLVADDPAQTAAATRLFIETDVSISSTVLLETEWVLRRSYRFTREQIAQAFEELCLVGNVSFQQPEGISQAIRNFRLGCDFADALHATMANPGATALITFDARFARLARSLAINPPVRLLESAGSG